MFFKRKPLPPTEEPRRVGNITGHICQCPNSFLIAPLNPSISVNPFPTASPSLPALGANEFEVTGIAMRQNRSIYKTQDVTPVTTAVVSVKPNYKRREYVLPIPAIGLDGIREGK